MGGGLMQLVAYGAQDVYLTGNPQITFFKVVYRRHTNFSMEAIEQTFNGTASVGSRVTATVSRNGDLIHRMYVETDVTCTNTSSLANTSVVNNIGHKLIQEVEIEIGGQKIDKHYALWLDIWAELTVPKGKQVGYDKMINAEVPVDAVDDGLGNPNSVTPGISTTTLYIPLQFWFCRNPGLALPLIALQYHEVKINISFESSANLSSASDDSCSIANTSLWVDYIYLDTDERRRFAQVSHEYLIEQLQFTGNESAGTTAHRLNFNHPIKELVWIQATPPVVGVAGAEQPTVVDWDQWVDTTSAKLQLNGHDRFAQRAGSYFTLVQPYQHHTCIPVRKSDGADALNPINVYSFALKPEDHQPSGTCNMSRIDNATLNITCTPAQKDNDIYIFAVNYNVLRIMGGMGGLAYSN